MKILVEWGEFQTIAEEMFKSQTQYEQEMQAQAKAEREVAPNFMQAVLIQELDEMVCQANRLSSIIGSKD